MLSIFKGIVFAITLLCSYTCFLEAVSGADCLSKDEASAIKLSYRNVLFSDEEIASLFYSGQDQGATHMLLVWDTFDYEDSYMFHVYAHPGEDVSDIVRYYSAPGFYRVSAVYALHVDVCEQLNEKSRHPWHTEYPQE